MTTQAPQFRAALRHSAIQQAESTYDERYGINRRLMQLVLARSSAQLLKNCADIARDPKAQKAFLCLVESIIAYRTHLQCGLALTQSALARLRLVSTYLNEQEQRARTPSSSPTHPSAATPRRAIALTTFTRRRSPPAMTTSDARSSTSRGSIRRRI